MCGESIKIRRKTEIERSGVIRFRETERKLIDEKNTILKDEEYTNCLVS